ncbi:glycosyltransferase family 2 protein [uncultured Maribacter sp.]|uniref:glycosyltransferase n=1 Tax=uncultured Maribacter sp. TaxID=431308 RepID=UPI00261980A5|nr:glycosyltransferase family 2 protein [uncultured Maribacter sp.]
MNHVVVGIPTYKRPKMLAKLVLSIYKCSLNPEYISKVDIVVVDNDGEKSGKKTCLELKKECPELFNIHYYCYPKKGLSNVRNEILNKALKLNPKYIASIDDDEYVTSAWLNELTKTMVNNNADIILAPVIPDFEANIPESISSCFLQKEIKNQLQLKTMERSGNYMIRSEFITQNNLSFDTRFNTTGAEDTFFGIQAVKKNAQIFWAAKAIAFETIPKSRSTFSWLFKRRYRTANTYTFIILIEKKYNLIFKKLIMIFFHFIVGILGSLILPFNTKNRYYGPLKLAESFGAFSSLINIKYHEYSKVR